MPVVPGFGEPVEHLEADEVQVPQPVAFAMGLACHGMLRDIVHEPVAVGIVFLVLNFQHDSLEAFVLDDHVRDDLLTQGAFYRRIYEGELVYAVSSVQLEYGVEKACRERHVFGGAE